MPAPIPAPLREAKQLVVEGKTAEIFFTALLAHLGLFNIQVHDFGPIQDLRRFLKALRRKPHFMSMVDSLGIARDAETDAGNAFRSVCDALQATRLLVPPQPGLVVPGRPAVGVFLFPDCTKSGMLEDLCWDAVSGDPAFPCVDEFFTCLQRQGVAAPGNLAKARIQAFLASRQKSGLLLGQAAHARYFPWDSPAFLPLIQFLQAL
jgi:hypothetical protein